MTKQRKEELKKWEQGCEVLPCLVVSHLVLKGYETFERSDFLKVLNRGIEDYQIKEQNTKEQGQVLFMTSDYIRSINMACYDLVNNYDRMFVYDVIKEYL